ncbi:MAG: hypothetical protein GX410_03560 [Elusimicrobia bacterium]|nr:hypothetical protein [Elusimicrobiota bacterium]
MKLNRRRLVPAAALPLLLAVAGCSLVERAPKYGDLPPANAFVQVSDDQFPVFDDLSDKQSLLRSLNESIAYFREQVDKRAMFPIGDKRFSAEHMARSLEAFAKLYKDAKTPEELARGLKKNFELYKSLGSDGKGKVVYSSYYEPVLEASPVKAGKFQHPIYKRPPDLIQVSLGAFDPEKWRDDEIYGRVENEKLVPYFSRKDIDIDKALAGRGLELAWFEHRFDIMDLHVEGSARLHFTDGREFRARFAGTNNLKFRGPVTAMVEMGLISRDEVSHERAKRYLDQHKEMEPWLLATNKRYTFFSITPLTDPENGPLGSMGKPLVGGRSIAVDKKYAPLGALAFLKAPLPRIDADGTLLGVAPHARFAMCQDTGGAILGPGRVDYFAGTGAPAKAIATNTWGPGELYLLVMKLPD